MHEARHISVNLLDTNREAITGPISDVQSHAFSTNIGINPLIAAAMPVLALATELQQPISVDPATLSKSLRHEIKAFENAAFKNGYRTQMILAARYLLCALLDEVITQYHPDYLWHEEALLLFFQQETWGGERFFIILERSCEDPKTYIDLLELGYICLSLGFKGKYNQPRELRELGIFIDQLFQLIEQQRGEHQPALQNNPQTSPKTYWRLPPWWVVALGCGVLLAAVFIPYNSSLNKTVAPLAYNLNHYE